MSSAAGFYQAVVGFILVLATNLFVRKIDSENACFRMGNTKWLRQMKLLMLQVKQV